MPKDYYETLGVAKGATKEDIKRAYKRLAKKLHPDLNKDTNATEKFKEINEAASVLGDDKRREQYDRFGTTGSTGEGFSGGFSGFDFSDFTSDAGESGFDFDSIFDTFFGGSSRGRRSGPKRGNDLRYDIEVTLEEVAKGTTKKVSITKMERCHACGGKGAADSSAVETCTRCGGSGILNIRRNTPFMVLTTQAVCDKCGGHGKVITKPCRECHGSGKVERTKKLDLEIPAGVEDGTRLRIASEGEAGDRSGPSGDLYVICHVKEHPLFERHDDDLYLEVEISFPQAALGADIEVPTIDSKAMLSIPSGTQGHTVLRMRGKGLPHLNGYGSGDQLVRVIIKTPEHLGSREREHVQKLAELMGDKVRTGKRFFSKFSR
ncbi:MAG: molecular chaperone DnaJ [Nanoarchaeota archaeon]